MSLTTTTTPTTYPRTPAIAGFLIKCTKCCEASLHKTLTFSKGKHLGTQRREIASWILAFLVTKSKGRTSQDELLVDRCLGWLGISSLWLSLSRTTPVAPKYLVTNLSMARSAIEGSEKRFLILTIWALGQRRWIDMW